MTAMRGTLIAFLALLLASTFGQEAIVSGVVVGITDGDTVKALVAGNELLRVRLSWIDAPEKSQAFGQRSKQHLSELVFGREAELHTHGLDRYGRTLAVIFVDGIDANLEQVRSGLAWVYEKYISQTDENTQAIYHAAQTAAQQERRGLWSDPSPVEPWEFRRLQKVGRPFAQRRPTPLFRSHPGWSSRLGSGRAPGCAATVLAPPLST